MKQPYEPPQVVVMDVSCEQMIIVASRENGLTLEIEDDTSSDASTARSGLNCFDDDIDDSLDWEINL